MRANSNYPVGRFYSFQASSWDPHSSPIKATAVIAATFHVLFGVSRRATSLLLSGLHDTVRTTLEYARGGPDQLDAQDQRLLRFVSRDPRTVVNAFGLDPAVVEYICCPECWALYLHDATAPDLCTYRSTQTSESCGAKLWKRRTVGDKQMRIPIRRYLHQSFKHWLGRMLSRIDIELWLEARRHPPPKAAGGSRPPPMKDIFDASGVHSLKGPDGLPFLLPQGEELRLVFSLSVDGFNPYQMKEAKQSVSSTAIYMVCLNLPPHLRYLPHNMYLVGVIPGPSKPATEQINHFVAPLVDEFLLFWDPGVYFSRTAKFSRGRLARVALLLLVCDLLAARQVSGFAAHNHTYVLCTLCHIISDDVENTNLCDIRRRKFLEHRAAALAWKDATSTYERERLFRSNGIRYSELLRLPYWNPILYTVIDTMHNVYLGVLQRHIRDFWGVSIDLDDGDALGSSGAYAPMRPSSDDMDKGLDLLLHGTDEQLAKCRKPVLYYLCFDRGLRCAGTTKILFRHLSGWVCLVS